MIKKRPIILMIGLVLGIFLVSCSLDANQEEYTDNEVKIIEIVTQEDQDKAAQLIVNNCYSCHSPDATKETRLAPPMSHVQSHYHNEHTNKADFVNAMSRFILKPTADDVIMYGAEKKFGVMPNMQFPEETVNLIANYLYDYEVETDDWLAKYYYVEQTSPVFEEGDYLGLGTHIALAAKQELGKNLKGKIKQEGTVAAVEFCQLNALPILDSISRAFDAQINRFSDKNRNPNGLANSKEVSYIKTYQNQLNEGGEMLPIVMETNDLATFYMPIVTNDMCLQCHGVEKEMDINVLSKIQTLYPNDKATGYGINQIRGIWKIEMSK